MQKSINLFDKHNNLIQLGPKLGTGGEGDVFELNSNLVVKIYHQPLQAIKQDKLLAMSEVHTPPLLEISTWPLGTVHLGKQGPVGGLVMPKLVGYKEIHKLYGPAHRKTEFPLADWTFLIQAARNTAAAIATLHQSGYVVGDINPGNLAVSASALTKLIDCDSFQVKLKGQHYSCEVGVAHFTPPELQGKSFSNIIRTPNHDNFGLALLCFHLLFMGRHPFAGKYKDGKEDMSIEKAIREFRFAYGTKSASKGMSSPPNTLPLNIVGPELAQMFEAAFEQSGVFSGRPTASHWVKGLDNLKGSLVVCARYAPHKFYQALSDCPWCAVEVNSGTVFFLPTSPIKIKTALDLARVWQEILAISPPGIFNLPNFSFTHSPQPLPTLLLAPNVRPKEYAQETEDRRALLASAELAWKDIQKRWSEEVSDAEFTVKLAKLKSIHQRLLDLNAQLKNNQKQLEAKTEQLQLRSYLEKYYIDSVKFHGIGQTRKATLASYGIETAADIDQTKIASIPGFGPTLTFSLVQWRKGLESKFVYNPQKVTPSAEASKLLHQYNIASTTLESALLSGIEELKLIKEEINRKRKGLMEEAEKRASVFEQSQADWFLLKHHLEHIQRRKASTLIGSFFCKPPIDSPNTPLPTNVSGSQTATNAPIFQSPNQGYVSQTSNQVVPPQPTNQGTATQNYTGTLATPTSPLPKKKESNILGFTIITVIILILLYILALLSYEPSVSPINIINTHTPSIQQTVQPKPSWTPTRRITVTPTLTSTPVLVPTAVRYNEDKLIKSR